MRPTLSLVALAAAAPLVVVAMRHDPQPPAPPPKPSCPGAVVDPRPSERSGATWRACGPGCLELERDWADGPWRFFGAAGASSGGTSWIAYTRDLGDALEQEIVRLPENRAVARARLPGRFSGCSLRLMDLSSSAALFDTDLYAPSERSSGRQLAAWPLDGAPPEISERLAPGTPLEAITDGDLLVTTTTRRSIQVRGGANTDMETETIWTAGDGELAAGLVAHAGILFWSVVQSGRPRLMVWDVKGGARPLVTPAPDRAAGPIHTDGHALVWLEGAEQDPTTRRWRSTRLVTAPFTTRAEDLRPRVLRTSIQDYLAEDEAVVGGGYALNREVRRDGQDRLVLTRLSDGAAWVIPPRGDFRWGTPLYVDGTELAVVENAPSRVFQTQGIAYGESWTIVRRTIASLGAPTEGAAP